MKNQKTIDSIRHPGLRLRHDLSQLGKDIYNNALEYQKSPGAINQDSIN